MLFPRVGACSPLGVLPFMLDRSDIYSCFEYHRTNSFSLKHFFSFSCECNRQRISSAQVLVEGCVRKTSIQRRSFSQEEKKNAEKSAITGNIWLNEAVHTNNLYYGTLYTGC